MWYIPSNGLTCAVAIRRTMALRPPYLAITASVPRVSIDLRGKTATKLGPKVFLGAWLVKSTANPHGTAGVSMIMIHSTSGVPSAMHLTLY